MIGQLIRIQKELALMVNSPCLDDSDVLEKITEFINKLSPYELIIVDRTAVVRHKKTLKVL